MATSQVTRYLWIALILSWIAVTVGRGIDLNLCDKTSINCQCGSPGYSFSIEVKQCTYFYQWKPNCKPCNGVSADNLCPRYSNCLSCKAGEDKCVSCPPGKYGDWCTIDCQCQNGAICSRDGHCTCRSGYEGIHCEIAMKKPICADPGNPENSVRTLSSGTFDNLEGGSSIHFRCVEGTVLIGTSSITCTSAGRWSSDNPTCSKVCPALTEPVNGRMTLKNSVHDRAVSGSTAVFTCDSDMRLDGESTLTCTKDGTWNHHPPTCQSNGKPSAVELWRLDIYVPRLQATSSPTIRSDIIDLLRSRYANLHFEYGEAPSANCSVQQENDDWLPIDWRSPGFSNGISSLLKRNITKRLPEVKPI